MTDKHLPRQSDTGPGPGAVAARVLKMGAVVESQVRKAVDALVYLSVEAAAEVMESEERVNALEVSIERELSYLIPRVQADARDLRMLMALSKITANLERAADEAARLARRVKSIVKGDVFAIPAAAELCLQADRAASLLSKALDAFARLDVRVALSVMKDDDDADREFDRFVRKLMTAMIDRPRTIASGLDLLFAAKILERVADHARNIAKFVPYVVEGQDVRHASLDASEPEPKQ